MKELIGSFKKTLRIIGIFSDYFGALFGGLYVFINLGLNDELWLYFSFVIGVIVIVTINFFVDKILKKEESDRKVLRILSYVSSFFYYTTVVASIMFITRYYLDFSEYKDLIAFIDILTFILVAYGSVTLNLIFKEKISSFKFRTILYFSVILYLSLGIFNIVPEFSSEINYYWMIILIDNFMFMVFRKRFNEILVLNN